LIPVRDIFAGLRAIPSVTQEQAARMAAMLSRQWAAAERAARDAERAKAAARVQADQIAAFLARGEASHSVWTDRHTPPLAVSLALVGAP